MDNYTHLMLSGGGYLGYIYIGTYRFLKEYNMLKTIKHLYGTSIGAIFAFLYGLDISYERFEELFIEGYMSDREYHTYDLTNFVAIPKLFGMFSTKTPRIPLSKVLQEVFNIEDITFVDYLKKTGKDLHINAVCVNTQTSVDFCSESHPTMSVLTAIEASICVPFIFKPVMYEEHYYVDGGTMNNLPLHLLTTSPGQKGLAFSIDRIIDSKIQNFLDYTMRIMLAIAKSSYQIEITNNKQIDIITFDKIPIGDLPIYTDKEKQYIQYSKEDIEKAIYYGYEIIYKFFFTNSIKLSTERSPSKDTDFEPTINST